MYSKFYILQTVSDIKDVWHAMPLPNRHTPRMGMLWSHGTYTRNK